MSSVIQGVFMILGAYMLGSIPWGFIIGKMYGIEEYRSNQCHAYCGQDSRKDLLFAGFS